MQTWWVYVNSSFPGDSLPARSANETGDSFVCFYRDVDGGNDEGKKKHPSQHCRSFITIINNILYAF